MCQIFLQLQIKGEKLNTDTKTKNKQILAKTSNYCHPLQLYR